MLDSLPPDLVQPVLGLLFAGIVAALCLVARLHPVVSALLGAALVAGPVALGIHLFGIGFFRSEGSAAGLVFFMLFVVAGVVSATMGIVFLAQGVIAIVRGEKPWVPGRYVLAGAAGLALGVAGAVAGWNVYRAHEAKEYRAKSEALVRERAERIAAKRPKPAPEPAEAPRPELSEADAALRTRFRECVKRMVENREQETQGECARQHQAEWDARVASGASFEPFHNEAELAGSIARSHITHAYAVKDFAGGLAGVRRVEQLARTRFVGPQYAAFLAELKSYEADLAAKAGAR